MFDEIIVIGEVAAKQTEEYDGHFGTVSGYMRLCMAQSSMSVSWKEVL